MLKLFLLNPCGNFLLSLLDIRDRIVDLVILFWRDLFCRVFRILRVLGVLFWFEAILDQLNLFLSLASSKAIEKCLVRDVMPIAFIFVVVRVVLDPLPCHLEDHLGYGIPLAVFLFLFQLL